VKPGDILVGKVTPKGETQLTPEEKLLRAIFGEKAGDVRDASLYCPPGIEGIVVDVKIFSRKGVEKDERAKQIEDAEIYMMEKNLKDEIRILQDERDKRIEDSSTARKWPRTSSTPRARRCVKKGDTLTRDALRRLRHSEILKLRVKTRAARIPASASREIIDKTERQIEVLKALFAEKESRLKRGDELPPGVIKMVNVFIAMKRKLSGGRQDGRPSR
jgi:DNA-directed RNA polymerase subunit beta